MTEQWNSAAKIGKIVRHFRIERGITQTELANRIGWKKPTVCNFEKGKRKELDVKDVEKSALALHIPFEHLLLEPREEHEDELSSEKLMQRIGEYVADLNPIQRKKVWSVVAEVVSAMA